MSRKHREKISRIFQDFLEGLSTVAYNICEKDLANEDIISSCFINRNIRNQSFHNFQLLSLNRISLAIVRGLIY